MTISTETTARVHFNIATGVDIDEDFPVYQESDIYVYYGNIDPAIAILNTDYSITLAGDFNTFTVTPLSPLLAKINDLIDKDDTGVEVNYITVRRRLDFLTDSTPAAVRYTPFTSFEFDRTSMRFSQLQEATDRALFLGPSFVGGGFFNTNINPVASNVLQVNPAGDGFIFTPLISAAFTGDMVGAGIFNMKDGESPQDAVSRLQLDAIEQLALNTHVRQVDIDRIHGLLTTHDARVGIMGDSTAAGVGGGGGPYGQCNSPRKTGWTSDLWWEMAKADPGWIEIDIGEFSPHYKVRDAVNGSGAGFYTQWDIIVSDDNTTVFSCTQKTRYNSNLFTAYHPVRASAHAPTWKITVAKDELFTQIITEGGAAVTIDPYVPYDDFDGNEVEVINRMTKTTLTLTETPPNTIYVKIENLILLERDGVTETDGTAVIGGFAFGNGIEVNNAAVSSSTLKNNSLANQSRGITTTERLTFLQDKDTNIFVIVLGTNDSKDEVSDEITFKAEGLQLIADIRAVKPEAVIFWATAPKGEVGSIYENNVVFNEVIRDIVREGGISLIEVEKLFDVMEHDVVYADDGADKVHPSDAGYRAIARMIIRSWQLTTNSLQHVSPVYGEHEPTVSYEDISSSASGGVGVLDTIVSKIIERPSGMSVLRVDVRMQISDAVAIVNAEVVLEVRGYPKGGGQGTPTTWREMDRFKFNDQSERKAPLYIFGTWKDSAKVSYEVRVQASDCDVSSSAHNRMELFWQAR